MTQAEYEHLIMSADRAFASRIQNLRQEIKVKYSSPPIGARFCTSKAQADAQAQLKEAMEAEYQTRVQGIRDEVEAAFFGTAGRAELKKRVYSAPATLILYK